MPDVPKVEDQDSTLSSVLSHLPWICPLLQWLKETGVLQRARDCSGCHGPWLCGSPGTWYGQPQNTFNSSIQELNRAP